MTMPIDDENVKLEIGIGADLSQLESDIEKAEEKIAAIGEGSEKKPIKIAIEPDINVKAFISQIQKAVKSQTVKVRVDAGAVSKSVKSRAKEDTAGVVAPKIDITDASRQLDRLRARVNEIKQVAGNEDVSFRIDKNAADEITRGVITYTNALGQAQSETYKLVETLDEAGNVASREFQFVGETLSDSTTKAARFREAVKSVENALNTFAAKNADIADQVGIDELREKFAELKNDTNAEVTAVQQFRNEMGAAKVKVDEIRMAQKAQADAQRQSMREQVEAARQLRAEERAVLQERAAYEQAINQLKSVSMSSYRQEQKKITEILKQQIDLINRRVAAEKKSTASNRQVVAAVQLQKATMETTAYVARLAIYAKDVAKKIEKARNNMAGMQGYARSTANIFKGIVLSQAFYKGLNAVKGVVAEAWELSVALNTAEATFSGMLAGGQQQAEALLEVLKQEAINTPFDVNNLVDASRLLTAYGIKAEHLMHVMRAVEQATAASGDASKMSRISLALGQIYTKGRLVGEEVRQLTEAGIAVTEILTEELGLTKEDIKKGWAALSIDANTAINAIVRGIDTRYGQALDNMAKTTRQKINNMRESFALITSSLTDPVRRAIDSIIDIITPKIEQLYQAIQAVGLGNALKTLIPPGIYNAVVTAINGIVRAVQAIGIVFRQIKPIVTAVMNALAWYGRIIYNIFISVLSVLGLFGQSLGESASGAARLETVLKAVLGAMLAIKTAMLIVAAASKIWTVMSTVMRGVLLITQGVGTAIRILAATTAAAGMASATGFLPVVGILLVIIGLAAALAGQLGAVVDAAKRVGAALKNLGGGTKLGNMFQDMSDSLQTQIDAYNAKVVKQNADFGHALVEGQDEQTDHAADAAGATKKAMEGLMSFDEVYKLMEPSKGGGAGIEPIEITLDPMPAYDMGGIWDDVGGLGEGIIEALDLSELQSALSGLWTEIYPLLDDVLWYVAKMVGYFVQMHLYSKMMTSENKEQWTFEKQQTAEDTEQLAREKLQTSEDSEQLAKEKLQTSEDSEQTAKEKLQTSEDSEQLAKEKLQTSEDSEQLAKEKLQSAEDSEQLAREKLQTAEDSEQLAYEKLQTQEDHEQWTLTKTGGAGSAGKGTAAALALINLAQIGTSAKLLADDLKTLAAGGAELGDWMSLFVNGLMMAVDVLQLISAFKIIFGGAGTAGSAGGLFAGLGGAIGGKAVAGAPIPAIPAATATGGAAAGAGLFAGLVAIPAVVGGIILALTKDIDTVYKYADKIDKIQRDREGRSGEISALLKAEQGHAEKLTIQYGELAGKEKLSAAESDKMKQISQKLVEIYPGLNKYVDEETGLLKLSATSMDSYVQAANQRADLDYLSKEKIALLDEERILLDLLAIAEAEEAEAHENLSKSKSKWDQMQYDDKKNNTDQIRALLEQNGIDLKNNEDAYAENAGNISEFQEEILETIADRIKREAEELASQQEAYRSYYLDLESKTSEHHTRLNALSAGGYAEAELSMDDWLKGMTKRQEQEYEIQENLAKLKGRDIPAGMLEELEAAGPQYSKLIKELANANDDDLGKVVDVWEENGRLAQKLALDELGEMPDEAKKLLERYRNATGDELDKLVTSYAEQHKLSREEAIKELNGLPTDSAKVIQKATGHVIGTGASDMRKAYAKMGKEGVEGLASTEKDALRASGKMADAAVKEADKRVKEMGGVGGDSGNAYVGGITGAAGDSKKAGGTLAQSAADSAKSSSMIGAWSHAGSSSYQSYLDGLGTGSTKASNAGKALAEQARTGAGLVSLFSEGADAGQSLAGGITSKSMSVSNSFKTLLNNMLGSMDKFTGKTATALNTLLSDFGKSMSNLSISTTGKVSYTPVTTSRMTLLADGGQIHRAARGIQMLRRPTMLASNVQGGEAGAEIVFPLQNTRFIKAFADDIARAVNNLSMQQATRGFNVQMEQARAGAAQAAFNAPSATDISDAIRSWFTPQMQSLHDVLEQDRIVDIKVPNTSNAMWRMLLTELKGANAGSGARGFLTS